MKTLYLSSISSILLSLSCWSQAAPPNPTSKHEITHLLTYVEQSGCQLNRNGSWYTSQEATAHLNKKYQYLLDKDLISTTESFIAKAATESSMSGKAYLVKCQANAPIESASWLKTELLRYRQASH
ncbi:DUF5329 domain-containing protein [Undibacterium sp. Rencai35W]|uniref:DUF5329 domain-containing protein n=1 Tax=Undibacterium sp. Rencai35W TaxID=3413046 RepID=UPI003BF08427